MLNPYTNCSKIKNLSEDPNKLMEWKDSYRLILDKVLTNVTEPPILAYPDFDLSFIPHTDASGED